jgi:hypothetical protein
MGRPRKYPEGTSTTERVNASVAALKRRGGARKTWRLSPQAAEALTIIMRASSAKTETTVINRLLLDEKNRLFLS